MARFYFQLENIEPKGNFTEPVHYKEIFSGAHKRELLVFITDFYQKNGEIMRLLDALSLMKHEIIVFHIMGNNELELDYKGYTSLEDLETGEKIPVESGKSGDEYQQKLDAHLSALRSQLLDRGIFYRMVNMQQPLDQVLRDFLNQRIKLKV